MMIRLKTLINGAILVQEDADRKITKLTNTGELTKSDKLLIRKYENAVDWNVIDNVSDFRGKVSALIDHGDDVNDSVFTLSDWIAGMTRLHVDPSLVYVIIRGIKNKYKNTRNMTPKGFVSSVFQDVLAKKPFKNFNAFEKDYIYALRNYAYDMVVKDNIVYIDTWGGEWIHIPNIERGDTNSRIAMNILSADNWCVGKSLRVCTNTYNKYDFFYRINPKTKQADVSIRRNPSGKLDEWSGTIGDFDQDLTKNEEKYKDEFEANYLFRMDTLIDNIIAGKASDDDIIEGLGDSEFLTNIVHNHGIDLLTNVISKLKIPKNVLQNLKQIYYTNHEGHSIPESMLSIMDESELFSWALESSITSSDGKLNEKYLEKVLRNPKYLRSVLTNMLISDYYPIDDLSDNLEDAVLDITDSELLRLIDDIVEVLTEFQSSLLGDEITKRGLEDDLYEHGKAIEGDTFYELDNSHI